MTLFCLGSDVIQPIQNHSPKLINSHWQHTSASLTNYCYLFTDSKMWHATKLFAQGLRGTGTDWVFTGNFRKGRHNVITQKEIQRLHSSWRSFSYNSTLAWPRLCVNTSSTIFLHTAIWLPPLCWVTTQPCKKSQTSLLLKHVFWNK